VTAIERFNSEVSSDMFDDMDVDVGMTLEQRRMMANNQS